VKSGDLRVVRARARACIAVGVVGRKREAKRVEGTNLGHTWQGTSHLGCDTAWCRSKLKMVLSCVSSGI